MNLARKKLRTLSEEERAKLYKNVFASSDAQLVLEDLKERGFFYTSTFRNDLPGLERSIEYNEGIRASVLHIETMLNYEPNPEEDLGE